MSFYDDGTCHIWNIEKFLPLAGLKIFGLFGEFGPLSDIYLPCDHYTGVPCGFGFVQYVYSKDSAEAKHEMDGQVTLGREIIVVFVEENRKKPPDMRAREPLSSKQSLGHFNPRSSS